MNTAQQQLLRDNNISEGSKSLDGEHWWVNPETFRFWGQPLINYLKTTSAEFPLGTGFKVGDSAEKVFAYYTQKYGAPEITDSYNEYSNQTGYTFRFGSGLAELTFEISGKEPSGNSRIVSIALFCSNASSD